MPHPLCTVHLECCTHVAESLFPLYISFQLHGMVFPPRLTAETTNAFTERGYVSLRCTSIMAGRNFQKSLSQVAKLSSLWEDVGHLQTLNIPAPGKFQC